MKKEYDFSKMKTYKNPFACALKKQVTLRLDRDVIEYFKAMAAEHDVSYQWLINLYLMECMGKRRKLKIHWHVTQRTAKKPQRTAKK